jgi:hypothetical protein
MCDDNSLICWWKRRVHQWLIRKYYIEKDMNWCAYKKDDIGFVHIIVKYSSHDDLNNYDNFCDIICFSSIFFWRPQFS